MSPPHGMLEQDGSVVVLAYDRVVVDVGGLGGEFQVAFPGVAGQAVLLLGEALVAGAG